MTAKKLFAQIICCANVNSKECSTIVSQQAPFAPNWQCPEPWIGDIDNASVLCIGMNPNITTDEYYPKVKCVPNGFADACACGKSGLDNEVNDFFEKRFDLTRKFVSANFQPLLNDQKTYSKNPCKYWLGVNAIIPAIFPNAGSLQLGKDIVLTDIVHCKSKKGKGVNKALPKCWPLTEQIINLFLQNCNKQRKTIIVFGNAAQDAFKSSIKGSLKTIAKNYVTRNYVVNGIVVNRYERDKYELTVSTGTTTITADVIFAIHPSAL